MANLFNNGPGFKTRQQIAAEYGIDVRTLVSNLRKLNIKLLTGNLPLKKQKQVYEALGYPEGVNKKDYEAV